MIVKSNRTSKKVAKAEKPAKNTRVDLGSAEITSPSPSKGEGKTRNLDVIVYSQDGKESSNMSLPVEIFGLKVNADLIAQAVRAQLANSRENIAHAKDRSEVRGGGKKPWKQKGTGRARHASIRSPLWAGGGVTFGPRNEKNFSVKINKKMKRQALLMALSGKLRDGELLILEDLKLAQAKTKEMAQIVKSLNSRFRQDFGGQAKVKSDLDRGAMIVMREKDEMLTRAAQNLPKISTIGVGSLNIVDILSVRYLVIMRKAIEGIKEKYGK